MHVWRVGWMEVSEGVLNPFGNWVKRAGYWIAGRAGGNW